MLYDCLRATTYKLFNTLPRPNIRKNDNILEGKFIITYLYQEGDAVLSPKVMVKAFPEEWMLKGKAFAIKNRSSREIILLYANSDIILRHWRNRNDDDYFSFFLLPHNGYLQIQESEEMGESDKNRISWAEHHANSLRIVFDKSTTEVSRISDALKKMIPIVQVKKYSIS